MIMIHIWETTLKKKRWCYNNNNGWMISIDIENVNINNDKKKGMKNS